MKFLTKMITIIKIILCSVVISMSMIPANANQIDTQFITSTTAVSQAGRFVVKFHNPLIIDKSPSLSLNHFLAYRSIKKPIRFLMGAIPGDVSLQETCDHPSFLQEEKIVDNLSGKLIKEKYLYDEMHHGAYGCVLELSDTRIVLIFRHPKPFVNQTGEKINCVAIVATRKIINALSTTMSFNIPPKDYFINLLQLSQTFSPFHREIDWQDIEKNGVAAIGAHTATCQGLSAAAQYLLPALNKIDQHSFITLKGLGTSSCPSVEIPYNDAIKRWRAYSETTRDAIMKYVDSFHAYRLPNNIVYLYLPPFSAHDQASIDKYIQDGRQFLNDIDLQHAKGLIRVC